MSSSICSCCSMSFSLFKRKYRCVGCRLSFCTTCFKKGLDIPDRNVKHCLKCHAFSSEPFKTPELMLLTIKELKAFLQQHNVPTTGCAEKRDLVDAIINYQKPARSSSNSGSTRSSSSTPSQTGSTSSSHNDSFHNQSTPQSFPENNLYSTSPLTRDFFGVLNRELRNSGTRNANRTTSPTVSTNRSYNSLPLTPDFLGMLDRELGNSGTSNAAGNANFLHSVFVLNDDEVQNVQPPERHVDIPTTASQNQNHSSPKPPPLEDCEDSNDIKMLSVKELKAQLDENFVDYKGCCEKDELIQRVMMLWQSKKSEENASGENVNSAAGESEICKVCMDNMVDCVLLECGHMMTCVECGKKLRECPMCRQSISRIVRVFKS